MSDPEFAKDAELQARGWGWGWTVGWLGGGRPLPLRWPRLVNGGVVDTVDGCGGAIHQRVGRVSHTATCLSGLQLL